MSSFNSNSLAQVRAVLNKTLKGYDNDLTKYVAYAHLYKEDVDAQHGVIPRQITQETIGTNQRSSKTAKGAQVVRGDWSLGAIQYSTEDFIAEFAIDKFDLDEMTSRQLDNISNMWKRGANQTLLDLDFELATIIKGDGTGSQALDSLTLNAGEEFNNFDSQTSDPDGTIMAMVESTMGGNFCIMGRDVANALKRHPAIGAKYYAPGSRADRTLSDAQLIDWLKSQHNMEEVVIEGTFYQNGSSQFPLDPSRAFAGCFYVGHKENLVLVNYKPLGQHAYDDESTRQRVAQAFHVSTIVVQDPALGLALKKVLE